MQLQRFQVQGFKNFRTPVVLEELGAINVIHGDNNAGKSNLLEAIGLFFALLEVLFDVASRHPLAEPTSASRSGRPSRQRQAYIAGRSAKSGVASGHQGEERDDGSSSTLGFPVASEYLRSLGYPEDEIFHIGASLPIDLGAVFQLSETEQRDVSELVQTDGAEAIAVDRIEVTLRLDRVDDEVTLLLQTFVGSHTHKPAVSSRALQPSRRWGRFLTRCRHTDEQPRFDLLHANRVFDAATRGSDAAAYHPRAMIPEKIAAALWDAKESLEAGPRHVYKRFQAAMKAFTPLTGEGVFTAVYERHHGRARLVFDRGIDESRIPAHLLGAGVQQIVTLVGYLALQGGAILAVEEPEINLRYTRQCELRAAFEQLVHGDGGPVQLFLSSHSPAFESGECFYALRSRSEGPVIQRCSVADAGQFTEHASIIPPAQGHAPLCYVSSEGLVQVPADIRVLLGVEGGGGVVFIENVGTGHVEMLNNEQFVALIESHGDDDDDDGVDGDNSRAGDGNGDGI